MNVQDYPITELFGCQPGYPLNQNLCPPGQGFHNGIDYGCPTGTPIVVNGVTIGVSGATGEVTGPHCHVGRWVGGKATDPGVGNGFTFNNAVVTEINQDSTNGKYVRVQGDGASWVYLHMSDNSKVSVGQVLQGGSMTTPIDVLRIIATEIEGFAFEATHSGQNDKQLNDAWGNQPAENYVRHAWNVQPIKRANIQASLDTANVLTTDLTSKNNDLVAKNVDLQKQLDAATGGDAIIITRKGFGAAFDFLKQWFGGKN